MWRSYDPSIIDAELKTLADHGLTMTRSFFYWPDFMPAPDHIDEVMVARFADFLDRHQAHGLTTIPTFIVGHMSGENWDPAWRAGRDLYSDVYMVGRQAWFAAEMTRRFTHHRAVAGWLVSNEMPLYGGANTDHHTVEAWARLIRDAVRAAGGHQPFSLGDGAWGIEVRGHDNGFRLTDIAPLVDFLGPHVYPVGDDPVRQKYAAALDCELAGSFGKPVIMEEFGVSSDFAAEDNAASYYRHVLWSTLLAGATGWIGWNNTDFALTTQDPYRHHSFELNFGLTDATGRPKKTLAEMRAFKQALDAIGFPGLQREDTDTAIMDPAARRRPGHDPHPRAGQAAQRGGGRSRCRRQGVRLLRRRGDAGSRRDDPDRVADTAQCHDQAARRGDGGDRHLELPARDHGVENRARARRRMHRGGQARRADPAHRAVGHRGGGTGGTAGRRTQLGERARRHRGRRPCRAPVGAKDQFHRGHRDRPAAAASGRRRHQERHAGARRPLADDRPGRRADGAGRRRRRETVVP